MLKFYTNLTMSDYKQKPSGHTLSLVEKESTQMTTSRTCMKLPERNNEFRQKEYQLINIQLIQINQVRQCHGNH